MTLARANTINVPQQASDNGPVLVQLALQTLARFNFKVCVPMLSELNTFLTFS